MCVCQRKKHKKKEKQQLAATGLMSIHCWAWHHWCKMLYFQASTMARPPKWASKRNCKSCL